MGQRGKLARYPIHWHMMGDAPGQYARGNSIWHSFSRCVTVHGTNDVTVANNVCYDHAGHGYFLEDGIETRNTFSGNLGVLTRIPPAGKRLLPTDATPATFWMTNPDNTWHGNVAAGSEGHGFWIALPEHPTGLSTTHECLAAVSAACASSPATCRTRIGSTVCMPMMVQRADGTTRHDVLLAASRSRRTRRPR